MPDEAEPRERAKLFKERFRYWLHGLDWIVEVEGCTRQDAFFKLGDAICCGDVKAVDGRGAPLPPMSFTIGLLKSSATSLKETNLPRPMRRCGGDRNLSLTFSGRTY